MRTKNRTGLTEIRLKIVKLKEIKMGWCSSGCRSRKIKQSPQAQLPLTHEIIRKDGRNRGSRDECCSRECAEKLMEQIRSSEDVSIRPRLHGQAPTEYGIKKREREVSRKYDNNGVVRDLPPHRVYVRARRL